MFDVRSLTLSFVIGASLVACAQDSPPVELDLSEQGVASVVREREAFVLRDEGAHAIGRVTVEPNELHATLHGAAAALSWDVGVGTASCNGHSFVVARAVDKSWQRVAPAGESLAGCGDALLVAELLAEREGVAVPWRGDDLGPSFVEGFEMEQSACNTVSTWVFGSSCSSCYSAACRADRGGNPCAMDSHSCDSGAVYTTCTACFQI